MSTEAGVAMDRNSYRIAAEADPYLAAIDPRMESTVLLPEAGPNGDVGVAGEAANADQTVMVQRADKSWLKVELHKLTKEERETIAATCSPTRGNPDTAVLIYEKYAEAIAAKERARLNPAPMRTTDSDLVGEIDVRSSEDMNKFFNHLSKRQEAAPQVAFVMKESVKKKAVFKGAGWTMRGSYDDIIVGEYAIVLVFGVDDSSNVFLPTMESAEEAYDFTLKVDGLDTVFVLNSSSVQFDYGGKTFAVFPILEQ